MKIKSSLSEAAATSNSVLIKGKKIHGSVVKFNETTPYSHLPIVYLKKYTITRGPDAFIAISV
ncbi:hypothetical protein T01_4161 [Trichinella spiralis]|uniref:Uncharacterized protein n=1 Tax=Trichinella spiralis TaxID=6334 RepID=A0A0V1BEG6_TRISP|nr:hypothetical protein T01_4161 [Trichinella spiralis]